MTLERVALGFTVAGFVLAGIAVIAGQRNVTWLAIAFVSIAFILRMVLRWRGSAGRREDQ